jgi:hypothetical protein
VNDNAVTPIDDDPCRTRRQLLRRAALLGAAALLAGCQPQARTSDGSTAGSTDSPKVGGGDSHPVVPISNTDPCAERLHDICEPLLRYYLENQELPPNLETLRQMKGFASLELTCPVTKRPYLYNPVGVQNAVNKQRILIYDPAPVHAGMRWAVVIVSPEGDRALVTKVVALAESNFSLQIPVNR